MNAPPLLHARAAGAGILACLLAAAILAVRLNHVGARTCPNIGSLGSDRAWPQNATVTVHVNAYDFTQSEFNCIKAAFDNWNAASGNGGNQSGVRFNVTYSTTMVAIAGSYGVSKINTSDPYAYQVNQPSTLQGPDKTVAGETAHGSGGGYLGAAVTNIHQKVGTTTNAATNCTALQHTVSHEIGHTFGLGECVNCPSGSSTMVGIPAGDYNNTTRGTSGPTPCDNGKAKQVGGYSYPPCDPYEAQSCTFYGGQWDSVLCLCAGGGQWCPEQQYSCQPSESWSETQCRCVCNPMYCTPILVDMAGDGFQLTHPSEGITFDLTGDGSAEQVSWTAPGSDDSWLALDRNGNGVIDGGVELFGGVTPQPPFDLPNGFRALAVFDAPDKGGNGDGLIDRRDAIFSRLRLWKDSDHDGVSDAGELHDLPSADIAVLHLDYKESKRTDEHGNQFRYRAKVGDTKGERVGRWAWDVILTKSP